MKRIDTDNMTFTNQGGVIPRRPELKYGSLEAAKVGLIPVEAYPDVLVDEKDYKEVINDAHTKQIMPMYHQLNTWAANNFVSYQDGLPLCWAWSAAATIMDCRAMEDKETVLLSPTSLGYTTNWRAEGNYLESAIDGLKNVGITPIEYIDDDFNSTNLSYRTFKDGWDVVRKDYRLDVLWDTNYSNTKKMIQHCISILAYGRPLYSAWNHLGHAMEVVGVKWDESQTNNLIWLIRNSHGEDDLIEMVGSRAVPSEGYGFISTILA